MNIQQNEVLENIIHQIYKEVILEANISKDGISWETIISTEAEGVIERGTSYSISSGTVGICLFLLEYYRKYPSDDQKIIIIKTLNKAFLYYQKKTNEIGFYNGRGGLISTLAYGSHVLKDDSLLELCKTLIDHPLTDLQDTTYNLYSGLSGLILGILNASLYIKDDATIKRIESLTEALLVGANINQNGLYWDELSFASKQLPSFLYGNAGIIFLLQQLKTSFKTTSFDKIIEEAILFEDHYYDIKNSNWTDFYNESAYLKVNASNIKKRIESKALFLVEPRNTFSWYVGSPGILLSRNSLFTKAYADTYKASCNHISKSIQEKFPNFNLSNGLGGLILTLLKLDPIACADLVPSILTTLQDQYIKNNYFYSGHPLNHKYADLGLLRGETGVGYFLIKILQEKAISQSILFPEVTCDLTENGVREQLFLDFPLLPLKRIFPQMVANDVANKLNIKSYNNILLECEENSNKLNNLSFEHKISLAKFNLMKVEIDFRKEYFKFLYYGIPSNNNFEKYEMTNCCKILVNEEDKYLLVRRIGSVEVEQLSPFDALFMSFFSEGALQKKSFILQQFIEQLEVEADEDKSFVKNEITAKLEYNVKIGVLRGVR